MRIGRLATCLVAALLVLAACGLGTPSAAPTVRPELVWSRADIDLPDDVSEIAPGSTPGMVCSPCHAEQASLMLAVTATPGGFLAVGVQLPPPSAIAYESTDGRAWVPVPGFAPGDETRALGVASDAAGRVVIVGTAGSSAGAWTRETPGSPWRPVPDQPSLRAPAGGTAEMRAVTAWGDGWVAAGSVGAADGSRRAAIWWSGDGRAWELVPAAADDPGDARAFGVAADGGRVVVVGASLADGTGGAITWTATDGETWTRAEGGVLDTGAMRAVTAMPDGFVAVGVGSADDRAAAWVSADGIAWEAVPDQDALANDGQPIRMLGVTAAGGPEGTGGAPGVATGWDGIMAAGWESDAGNGSGVIWRSADGRTWERVPSQASMSGGSLSGVAVTGGTPVVVGTTGSPDNDQASAWFPDP
ncbi:MAG TPA: hypothetical protein VFY23_15595 [Candidatus Limnocylindrales bacterium]|nr:hypothetical protein [Candidatus Limnocylindrales bacterium]